MSVSLILLEIENEEAPGDATVAGYENQIVVESFSWGLSAQLLEKTIDDPVTKVDAQAVSIRKEFDRSSTVLREMMKDDRDFDATIRFIDPISRGTDGRIDAVMEFRLLGCHIDRLSLSAEDDGKSVSLSEDLTISYTESVTISYRSYDATKKTRGSATTAEIPNSGQD